MLERNVRWYQALPVILALPAVYFGLFVWSWKTAEYDYQRVVRQEAPVFAFTTSEDTVSGSTADEGAPPGNSPVAETQTCYTGVGYRIPVNCRDTRNLYWRCVRLEYTWRWLWPGLGLRMHSRHTHQTTPKETLEPPKGH